MNKAQSFQVVLITYIDFSTHIITFTFNYLCFVNFLKEMSHEKKKKSQMLQNHSGTAKEEKNGYFASESFLFIRGLSRPPSVQISLTQNCTWVSLQPPSCFCGDIGFFEEKNQCPYIAYSLEISTFLGPNGTRYARCHFRAQKSLDFSAPPPLKAPCYGYAPLKTTSYRPI
jgi:hypothetical protein